MEVYDKAGVGFTYVGPLLDKPQGLDLEKLATGKSAGNHPGP